MGNINNDVKQGYRDVKDQARAAGREADGHQPADDLGNAGDDARRGLGKLGDDLREGAGDLRDRLTDVGGDVQDRLRDVQRDLQGTR